MSNTWVSPTIVADETIRELENNCVMANLVHRSYENEWKTTVNGWKKGQTIDIKAPLYARVQEGDAIHDVDIYERYTTFTLSYRYHVAYKVTAAEMTYSTGEKNYKQYTKAAAQAIGNFIDQTLLSLYKGIPAQVGTPGQTPKDFITLALANATLAKQGCPPTDIRGVLEPTAQAYICDALKNLYNPPINRPAVEQAKFARVANVDWYVSQNVNTHTNGTWAGNTLALAATASEGATTLSVDNGSGSWAYTAKQGDIFTSSGSYAVNPVSGATTGDLRQFCVDADAASGGSSGTIYCTPGTSPWKIYSESAADTYLPYQTVYGIPTNNDTVLVAGSASQQYPVNLVFHKDCLGLAMVPLEMPDSVTWKAQSNYKGYSISVVKDFDVKGYQEYLRFDVLFGVKVLNPFLGCRIAG